MRQVAATAAAAATAATGVYVYCKEGSLGRPNVRQRSVAHQFDSFRELLQNPALGEDLVGAEIHVFAARRHLAATCTYMIRVAPT